MTYLEKLFEEYTGEDFETLSRKCTYLGEFIKDDYEGNFIPFSFTEDDVIAELLSIIQLKLERDYCLLNALFGDDSKDFSDDVLEGVGYLEYTSYNNTIVFDRDNFFGYLLDDENTGFKYYNKLDKFIEEINYKTPLKLRIL